MTLTTPVRGKSKGSIPVGLKGRPRKVLQAVDTNISSYDRTDPFLAFNVLRKVLGALPSCQYKLSPEEHKLSMHLLTIVEPFVGLSPARRTMTRQPAEILDSIVFHVDTKRDLLSLGLTCHRLYDVIFPRHWDYRVIRCKVSSISVWSHLISNRYLARNVRRLEIIDERSAEKGLTPPGIMVTDTDLESTDDELGMHSKQERYLVSALTKMTALQRFSWSCNHSPISIDNVWPTLLSRHSLKEIEINDNLLFCPFANDDEGEHGYRRPHMLPGLRTVALRSTKHSYGTTKYPELSRISGMLSQCPKLESLDIGYDYRRMAGYTNPTADDLFLCSRWPYLTSLSLTNLRCNSAGGLDAAATFLHAHVNVEILHLDFGAANSGAGRSRLFLLPNSLPRLRELRSNKDIVCAVLECPCDSPRPLETIKGVRLSGTSRDQTFLGNLKTWGMAVKRMELAGWNEMDDVKRLVDCVPKLTWLDVGKRVGSGFSTGPLGKGMPTMHTSAVEWTELLSNLSDLTTFHGIRFFYEVSTADPVATVGVSDRSRVRKNDEIASVLAWKCPKLRRLDHWEEGSGKVIVLLRDGEKVKYEVRRVKL